jgi:hypothetical protein
MPLKMTVLLDILRCFVLDSPPWIESSAIRLPHGALALDRHCLRGRSSGEKLSNKYGERGAFA